MAEWSGAWNTHMPPFCAVVRNSLPPINVFFFEGFPGLSRVRIPFKIAIFSAAFSSHATYVRGSLWGSWIPPGGWGVAESGGNRLKLRNRLKLFSKKSFKIELLWNPSWNFRNSFWGVYPHQTHAPYTPCIPPNFKGHIGPSFPQGAYAIC